LISRVFASRFREKVVVTLKTGESFAGMLHAADKTALVLRYASAAGAGENATDLPLDGEVICLLADIAYLQRP
jgi:small nuclear ribonucleoprotein (snRNP)-like protein